MSKSDMGSTVIRKLLPVSGSGTGPLNGVNADIMGDVWSESEPTHGSGPTQDLQNSMSSVSSATSNSMSFNKVIKDFKKTLTENKTPKNLIYLNRIMVLIFIITIILSGIIYGIIS